MKKVLIIEDDFDIGEVVEMALSHKYQVVVKQDTQQLAEVLIQYIPDVILIDNYIGNKTAKEVIADLKSGSFNLNIPLVLFSAHNEIEILAGQIGAAGFLPKPFDLDSLYQCLERVLSSGK